MIKKLSPNRTIRSGRYLDKDSYRLLVSRAVLKIRHHPTDRLYEIIRDFPSGRWHTAAQMVIDARIEAIRKKIKPDNT